MADQSNVADFLERSSYLESTTSNYRKNISNFVPEDSGEVTAFFDELAQKTKNPCKTGLDTLVLSWYVRLLNPSKSYLQYLDHFRDHDEDGCFIDYEAGGHIEGFYYYKHRRKQETWVAVPDVVCDAYNPCAKFKSIRSSASRTYSQLKNLEGCENIVFLVLTFPKKISNKLLGSDQPQTIEKAHSCVARFIELLKKYLEAHINAYKSPDKRQSIPSNATFAYQYNPHPWKTSDPTKPHLHIHLDLLWACLDGGKLHPLKFHAVGKPLSDRFVKQLWKKAVSEVFDYDYGETKPVVNLEWSPLSRGKKVLHNLKYRRRKPITDLGEYYLDHDFDPDSFDDGFNEFLLNYTNKSYTHGFWTYLVKFVNEKENPNSSANVKICPVCGRKIKIELYFPIGEAVFDRVVVQNRHGKYFAVKPPPTAA